ncbi:MAG TPA: hypothetical protein VM677_11150 [Actinokineospora sp.]|nr:hypothetical protein [Actinokineospora sp.]
MRTRVSFVIAGIDATAAEVVPLVVGRWRELVFDDDGVVLVDGERREGLAVEAGAHPRAGTRYSLVTVGERAANYDVELVEDTASRFVVRVEQHGDVPIEFELTKPAERAAVRFAGEVGGKWPIGGRVRGDASVDLRRLPAGDGEPQVLISVEHSRVVGDAKAFVRGIDGGWRVDVDVRLRGSGITRVVLGPVIMIMGRRAVGEVVDKIAADLNAAVLSAGTPLDAVKVADRVARGFLDSVARYRIRT